MKKSYYFYTTFGLLIFLGLIISGYIFGWTVPSTTPPGGNLAPPINTGSTNQAKTGYLAVGTSTTPTYPLEVGNQLRVWGQLISKVASGTAPFVIDSPTKVANLNADLLDGYDSSDLLGGGGGGGGVSITSVNTPCTITGGSGYFKTTDICPGYGPERFVWSETGLSDTDSDGCPESENIPGFCLVRGPNSWIEPKYNQAVVVNLTSSISSFCSSYANVTLTWSTVGASSCTASGGWSGTKATSGSENISNITQTTTFTLTCTGTNRQPGTASVTVSKTTSCTEILIYMSPSAYTGNLGGRSGADSKCDLGATLNCQVNRAFISVNVDDEIRDMPSNYGVDTSIPVYWYNRSTGAKAKMGNNWADILDGSILVTQYNGTGINTNTWSGSDAYGTLKGTAFNCNNWWNGSSSYNAEYGQCASTNGQWLDYASSGCNANLYMFCLCQR